MRERSVSALTERSAVAVDEPTTVGPTVEVGTVRSAAYVFGSRMAVQMLSLVKGIVVARLLGPSELGAFFLVAAVVGAVEIASHPGLEDALIHSSDERPRLWQATWTALVVRGAAIGAALFVLSVPIADWLHAPEIVPMLRVVAIVPVLRGLTSLSLAWCTRQVDLRPAVMSDLFGNLLEMVLGVVFVAATESAWGLVAAMVAGTAARTLWSYRYAGFGPRFLFAWSEVRPLIGYSKWRFGSNLLYYLSVRADDLLVGRYLGPASLANYRVAYRLANVPTTEIVSVVERVAFPALARKARDAPSRALATYPRYLMLTCGLAGPMAAILAALAEPTVSALLGPAFADAAVPLAIMCLAGYLRAVVSTAGSLVLGLGRPGLDTLMGVARAVVLVVGIIVFARYGVAGAAVASLLSLVVTVPVWLWSLAAVGASPGAAVHVTLLRLPAALTAGIAAWGVSLTGWGPVARLIIGLVAGLAGFLIGMYLFDSPLRRELASIVRQVRRRGRRPKPADQEA